MNTRQWEPWHFGQPTCHLPLQALHVEVVRALHLHSNRAKHAASEPGAVLLQPLPRAKDARASLVQDLYRCGSLLLGLSMGAEAGGTAAAGRRSQRWKACIDTCQVMPGVPDSADPSLQGRESLRFKKQSDPLRTCCPQLQAPRPGALRPLAARSDVASPERVPRHAEYRQGPAVQS